MMTIPKATIENAKQTAIAFAIAFIAVLFGAWLVGSAIMSFVDMEWRNVASTPLGRFYLAVCMVISFRPANLLVLWEK